MARWPKYNPSENHRRQVLTMAGFGFRHVEIAKVMLCDAKTLRKHYRHELDTGEIEANARVAQSLFNMATRDKIPSAAIFWMKARAGWRDGGLYGTGAGPDDQPLTIITGVPRAEQLDAPDDRTIEGDALADDGEDDEEDGGSIKDE